MLENNREENETPSLMHCTVFFSVKNSSRELVLLTVSSFGLNAHMKILYM